MGSSMPGANPMYGNQQMGSMGPGMPGSYGGQSMGYGPQGMAYGTQQPPVAGGVPGQQGSMPGGQMPQTNLPGQNQGVPLSEPPPAPQPQKLYVQTTAIESAATMAATAHISFLWTMLALAGGVALGLTCGLYKRSKKGSGDEKKEEGDDDDDSSSSSSSDSE